MEENFYLNGRGGRHFLLLELILIFIQSRNVNVSFFLAISFVFFLLSGFLTIFSIRWTSDLFDTNLFWKTESSSCSTLPHHAHSLLITAVLSHQPS